MSFTLSTLPAALGCEVIPHAWTVSTLYIWFDSPYPWKTSFYFRVDSPVRGNVALKTGTKTSQVAVARTCVAPSEGSSFKPCRRTMGLRMSSKHLRFCVKFLNSFFSEVTEHVQFHCEVRWTFLSNRLAFLLASDHFLIDLFTAARLAAGFSSSSMFTPMMASAAGYAATAYFYNLGRFKFDAEQRQDCIYQIQNMRLAPL